MFTINHCDFKCKDPMQNLPFYTWGDPTNWDFAIIKGGGGGVTCFLLEEVDFLSRLSDFHLLAQEIMF